MDAQTYQDFGGENALLCEGTPTPWGAIRHINNRQACEIYFFYLLMYLKVQ